MECAYPITNHASGPASSFACLRAYASTPWYACGERFSSSCCAMERRSAEATNARLMWPSLREACAFFCADEAAAFFDFATGDFVEGDFLLDVWSEKPACNDTRAIQQVSKKRL